MEGVQRSIEELDQKTTALNERCDTIGGIAEDAQTRVEVLECSAQHGRGFSMGEVFLFGLMFVVALADVAMRLKRAESK